MTPFSRLFSDRTAGVGDPADGARPERGRGHREVERSGRRQRQPMQRCIRLLVFLLPLGPRLASGQQVEGRVMEVGTDAPITSAVVTALDADSTIVALALSDSTGRFILTVPEEVTARIRVERLGYTTVETVRLQLGQLDRIPLEVRLRPSPIELDGITAVARMQLNRNVRGFLRRQEHGFGRYAGPSEIARIRPVRSTDVLLPLSPRLVPDGDAGVKARTFPSIGGSTYCNPRVYVDRHLINDLDSEGEPAPPAGRFPCRFPIDSRGRGLRESAPGAAVLPGAVHGGLPGDRHLDGLRIRVG